MPVVIAFRTSLISFCTAQLRTLCAACSLATLFLYDFWSSPLKVAHLLGLHGSTPCAHPSKGAGNNNSCHSKQEIIKTTSHIHAASSYCWLEDASLIVDIHQLWFLIKQNHATQTRFGQAYESTPERLT